MDFKLECGLPCDVREGKFNILSENESEILESRFGFNLFSLCQKHYDDQFSKYSRIWHKHKCADPAKRHKKPMKTELQEIFLNIARLVKVSTEFRVIPGQMICRKCKQHILSFVSEVNMDHQKVVGGKNEVEGIEVQLLEGEGSEVSHVREGDGRVGEQSGEESNVKEGGEESSMGEGGEGGPLGEVREGQSGEEQGLDGDFELRTEGEDTEDEL